MNGKPNGAISPAGDRHPGEIVNEDQIDGHTFTQKASEVPQTIAWVQQNDKWKPVVRITMTGTANHREITTYGPNNEWLESTVSAPPPPAARPPEPVPVPVPVPTPTPPAKP